MTNKLQKVTNHGGAKITGILIAGDRFYVSYYRLFANGYIEGYNTALLDIDGESFKDIKAISTAIREINKYGAPIIGIKDYGISSSVIDDATKKISAGCDYDIENVSGKGKIKIDERPYIERDTEHPGNHYLYLLRKRGAKKSSGLVRVPSTLFTNESEGKHEPVKQTVEKLSTQKLRPAFTEREQTRGINSPKKRKTMSPRRRS